MELIKKIKQAETQAQQIIEKAKTETARQAEENRERRLETLAEAEQQRKKTIESAVAAAQSQGLAETEQLKEQAEKKRQQLHNKVAGKMARAVEKVMDYLRG